MPKFGVLLPRDTVGLGRHAGAATDGSARATVRVREFVHLLNCIGLSAATLAL
jgi:hypothetical protein